MRHSQLALKNLFQLSVPACCTTWAITASSISNTSYDSKQTSSGAGVSLCVPPLCYGASSASAR
ncbi:hypothetical protein [[Pantoea] beijingensis]|uniref:hypothetical protein n=1 Tax=[Pantoea] beijingensis TaxID=1324864 RepID=UPI000FE3111B|nr:hypothetical protein [[Pantoea] beijingensis]